MKNTILIIIFVSSIVSGATKFVYDKINSLKSELLQVKKLNADLTNKNNKLTAKQDSIKKKLKERRSHLAKKKLSRAKYKIGKAAIGVIPFIGTGAVAALTYTEIQGYCNDIKEYKEFEKSIFENSNESLNHEEQMLCGYNKDVIEEEIYKDLNSFKNEISTVVTSQYNLLSKYFESEYNNFLKEEKD